MLSQPQDHSAAGRIKSMKNSNKPIANRIHSIFRLVAPSLNQLRHRVPLNMRCAFVKTEVLQHTSTVVSKVLDSLGNRSDNITNTPPFPRAEHLNILSPLIHSLAKLLPDRTARIQATAFLQES